MKSDYRYPSPHEKQTFWFSKQSRASVVIIYLTFKTKQSSFKLKSTFTICLSRKNDFFSPLTNFGLSHQNETINLINFETSKNIESRIESWDFKKIFFINLIDQQSKCDCKPWNRRQDPALRLKPSTGTIKLNWVLWQGLPLCSYFPCTKIELRRRPPRKSQNFLQGFNNKIKKVFYDFWLWLELASKERHLNFWSGRKGWMFIRKIS